MPDAECTGFKAVVLDDERYGFALEGEKYDKSKEGRYSPYSKIFDFTLYAVPDIVGEKAPKTIEELKRTDAADYAAFLSDAPGSYTIGDLKDSNGNVLDKDNAKYEKGMTLTINLGSDAFNVAYSVTSLIGNLKTMHDLVPYAFPEATGDLNVLVVPIAWQDEKGNATDKAYDDLENEFRYFQLSFHAPHLLSTDSRWTSCARWYWRRSPAACRPRCSSFPRRKQVRSGSAWF